MKCPLPEAGPGGNRPSPDRIAGAAPKTALHVRNPRKAYKDVLAVDGLDPEVHAGFGKSPCGICVLTARQVEVAAPPWASRAWLPLGGAFSGLGWRT